MLSYFILAGFCLFLSAGVPIYSSHVPENFKVAIFGDAGLRQSRKVLQKCKDDWDVNLIIFSGDMSYDKDQSRWWEHLDRYLGENFPYIGTSGNHDLSSDAAESGYGFSASYWHKYAREIRKREERSGAQCKGIPGEMEVCYYNGLVIVNLGYTLKLDRKYHYSQKNYADFIADAFGSYPDAYWRICNFHQPVAPYGIDQRLTDIEEDDWSALHACAQYGAIVANAHSHSYTRTHLMSDYERQTISSKSSTLRLRPGYSVQWVSGLGGAWPSEIGAGLVERPFLAVTFAHPDSPGGLEDADPTNFGAVLCTFNPGGESPDKAKCEFRDITESVKDSFTLTSVELAKHSDGSVVKAMEKKWKERKTWYE